MRVLNAKDKKYGKTVRKNFARYEEVMEMPNLLAIQGGICGCGVHHR